MIIPFKRFPFVLNELLENSKAESLNNSFAAVKQKNVSCFIRQASEKEITLVFQEDSQLKQIKLLELELGIAAENKLKENIEMIINDLKFEKANLLRTNQDLKFNIETITIDLNQLRSDLDLIKGVHKKEIEEINKEHKYHLKKIENNYQEQLIKCEEEIKYLNKTNEHLNEEIKRCQEEVGDHIQINKILESNIQNKELDIKDLIKTIEEKDSMLNSENKKSYYQLRDQEVSCYSNYK